MRPPTPWLSSSRCWNGLLGSVPASWLCVPSDRLQIGKARVRCRTPQRVLAVGLDLGARQLVEKNRVAHGRPARCACRSRRGRRDQPPAPHPEACAECRRASTSVARRTVSGRMLTVTLTNDLDGTVYGIIQGCDRPTGLVVCSSAHYLMFSQFRVAGGLAASLLASFAASQE